MARKPKIERFNEKVLSKFQIYNSLFLTLPFENIKETSLFLPLFVETCKKGYEDNNKPIDIVTSFFDRYAPDFDEEKQKDLLFNFIQYIERQVVLFDAIEDASFSYVNNMHGRGTLRNIKEEAANKQLSETLSEYIKRFNVRIVLTAHPTQFYPDNVLVIINELSNAIAKDDLDSIKKLLVQLGKTPFYKKEKPTPFDEAVSLIWFLENVFYHSASTIYDYVAEHIINSNELDNSIFDFGFWPGGDRDGNPFVTAKITLKTAKRLQFSVLRNYYRDLRKLKRKITFPGAEHRVANLEQLVFNELFYPDRNTEFSLDILLNEMNTVLDIIINEHSGLYKEDIRNIIHKMKLFGLHFASLDIRQDSRVHHGVFTEIVSHPDIQSYVTGLPENYLDLTAEKRLKALSTMKGNVSPTIYGDEITQQTLESIRAMQSIQKTNGEKGSNRYIISNCQTLENILELFAMCRLSNWENPTVDFIPLFETIPDLESAEAVMEGLFNNPIYKAHLESRKNKQTVMLGFSDGTKDGGYFMANWSIYKAKEALSGLATKYGISMAFFDGRGGPPARGGGNTHEFYASMGDTIQSDDIQLTIQGQTISSNFGTLDSSQYNLEQLLSSGIASRILNPGKNNLSDADRKTMENIAVHSYEAYQNFKAHPMFIPYLERMSTLPFYAKTNIGSRPSKRGKSKGLQFEDLRAIPFVGSWSQLKQNVPGFFGVGTSIQHFINEGKIEYVKQLYKNSRFFRTLLFNSMMSLTKSFFKLTAYMKEDKEFGAFWELIFEEYKLTRALLLEVSDFKSLMENEPAGKASIRAREEIVQPLLTIQQFALIQLQILRKSKEVDAEKIQILEAMVTRSLFGNINASRNSA
ncbi:MAG: phosphoenolpyruvate carboxylase [Flavobacteriaceae bacterium]|nr:phosphoenolpyruvate carboxylase [Flavobacteriaceae bacterium]